MSPEKLYKVTYVGAEVVRLGRAGKFMPGTVAFLDDEGARAAAGRPDFIVAGLAEASAPMVPQPPAEPPAVARHALSWRSERTQRDMRLLRWGHAGRAVLVLPPGGGDAEAIEQQQLVEALRPLLEAGKIALFSVDDVAGRALAEREGDPSQRAGLLEQFQEYLAREVVPAMTAAGASPPAIVVGAGLGARHAVALLVRQPELFSHALCVSGIFDGDELRAAGAQLEALRGRFCVLACGEEDPAPSYAVARLLGDQGIPNRVDPWGAAAGREWAAWRAMIPKYLSEWT